MSFVWRCALLAVASMLLCGCSALPVAEPQSDVGRSPWATQSVHAGMEERAGPAAGQWQHYRLPGKTPTEFSYARKDGRHCIAAMAQSSASMLRNAVRIEPADLGKVRFSWKVPELIAQADGALRDADDSPVRIVLAFEGSRSSFSAKDAMLSELALALTGEEMPYATLMYVWSNKRPAGTVVPSPRTDRIRKLVVESGSKKLDQWLDYERDIRADFQRAFGEAPGALVGIAIMTDSDNTRSTTRAWYGPVQLAPVVLGKR
ncbi:DUF3047 domain-containing protein [uncultured Ramlibacter sp.]|uniref:DUF3047 domain-containing protein n=1 Tax=uncultured Ramlibacter sp. TaxID=260755 RepID=UPI0026042EFD|nr:DUF3047 domain-containing protein [uncultured Ramlibacter sp.]